ncbi:FRG domain-containing protein [Paenibacillus sp. FSL L8-0158]|uniref:FRG domain-containing protein n=1 Tax=Paenibacillus sp. FSL L8-0158 TaxID=2954752 RepID=UPI0031597A9E
MTYSEEWIDILNLVNDFCAEKKTVWFRGHSNSDFQLHSGLFREKQNKLENFMHLEIMAYRKFLNLGHLHHTERDWNLLYLMQHHGVKTRLLDWSESFTTALFFARSSWRTYQDACFWMLVPTSLNKLTRGKTQFLVPYEGPLYEDYLFERNGVRFPENSTALYPVRNSNRMVSQQGVFTMQGNSMLPLDEEHDGALIRGGNLVKVNLPLTVLTDVDNFLLQAGVTDYTMFPDLDGLAREVNRLHGYWPKITLKMNLPAD